MICIKQLSLMARQAVQSNQWQIVSYAANQILKIDSKSAEGFFLSGLADKYFHKKQQAISFFETSLEIDPNRYDSAVELAHQFAMIRRNSQACRLLDAYASKLSNSSVYANLAGTVYTEIGLPEKAYPLHQLAFQLQPTVSSFIANLAEVSVYLGKMDEASILYKRLISKSPLHQGNHYQLSRLKKATSYGHINEMKRILAKNHNTHDKNIFLYYAIGKELEDLEEWDEAFSFYKQGADAICQVANYNINDDINIINSVIRQASPEWLNQYQDVKPIDKQPIFIVGLPRTGSTLCERIISSHSNVTSLGETLFIQMLLKQYSKINSPERMSSEIIEALTDVNIEDMAEQYIECVRYRLGKEYYFIDKLPINVLYLGFIVKAFPNAKIVYLNRHPMDACFAMYKQVFTWAYKYSYSLDDLSKYYVAFTSLIEHWNDVLGDNFISIEYESLVSDPKEQITQLLKNLGLPFETQCLDFNKNKAPSTTASSVQVRSNINTKSINRWKKFSKHLSPLYKHLIQHDLLVER